MIYFIQAGERGPIKIGYTSHDLAGRFIKMQTDNYQQLTVLGVIPDGTFSEENELHRIFVSECIRGEWFHNSRRLMGYVKRKSMGYKLGKIVLENRKHSKGWKHKHKRRSFKEKERRRDKKRLEKMGLL